jgi:hypothetical protein
MNKKSITILALLAITCAVIGVVALNSARSESTIEMKKHSVLKTNKLRAHKEEDPIPEEEPTQEESPVEEEKKDFKACLQSSCADKVTEEDKQVFVSAEFNEVK